MVSVICKPAQWHSCCRYCQKIRAWLIVWLLTMSVYGTAQASDVIGANTTSPVTVSERRSEKTLLVALPDGDKASQAYTLAATILSKVYGAAGYSIQSFRRPFARLLVEVPRCRYDLIPGVLRLPHRKDMFHYSNIRLWTAPITILSRVGVFDQQAIKSDFKMRKVVALNGYKLADLVSDHAQVIRVNNVQQAVAMITAGRAEGFIDNHDVHVDAIKKYQLDPGQFNITVLREVPLYPVFCHSERGRELASIYERRIKVLYQSGELKKMFRRFELEFMYRFPEFDN